MYPRQQQAAWPLLTTAQCRVVPAPQPSRGTCGTAAAMVRYSRNLHSTLPNPHLVSGLGLFFHHLPGLTGMNWAESSHNHRQSAKE